MLICQDGVKRELNAGRPYGLFLRRDEARDLARAIKRCTEDEFSMGWVTVWPLDLGTFGAPNTKPLKWTEPGNVNPPSDFI
jgi:hypothetical protein